MYQLERLKALLQEWRADESRQYRIMSFGASETQIGGQTGSHLNWFHWLEESLRGDRVHFVMLNEGQGGNCIRDLCGRFARDCASLKPDLVFIQIGDNDAGIELPLDEYKEKLTRLCRQIKAFGGLPVLQTIYWPQVHNFSPYYQEHLADYFRINREVAEAEDFPFIDLITRRFRAYYEADPAQYARAVMRDNDHLNGVGNAVWGRMLTDLLGLPSIDLADLTNAVDQQIWIMKQLCGEDAE